MVSTMFVLDRTLNTSHILTANKNTQSAFWGDTYTQEFDTGAESLEFSCYTHESIKEGNYVTFFYNSQYKMFQIIEIEEVHKNGRLVSECYCETASLQLLNNYVRPFSGDMNCIQFFEFILNGTEWRIGKYSNSLKDKVVTINESSTESVWSLIEDYKDIFECEINVYVTYDNGHITGQFIDIFSEKGLGSATYKRFEYGKNVTGITKKKDLYDWCTAIIVDCNCDVTNTIISENQGLGFVKGAGDVILDDNHNRMYNAGRNHVIGVYSGDETEPVEACINAWKELEKRSVPKFDYQVTTALRDDEYEEIHLGDTVYVVDHSYTPPLLLEARVGKLELSFTDRSQNKCTLTNYKEIKSKLLDADYIKLTGTITDIVNAFFPITSEGIADGAICEGKIETTYFQQITADIVSASTAAFENLYAQGLTVINADIERLNATSGEITDLKAQVADIDTLVNGHLTSDNIQSMIITGDKFTVADGFIKNAMIDNITADKITTGSINTNNVYISSADGSMILNGSLQQFKDKDGNVRIQIGKDAQDNFTFSLFDEDGEGVLINEKGITENAIADGLIVDVHVADDANISGSKLDIDSVVTEINDGTSTIKGTKVILDDTNQTLDVAFNILNTKVDDVEEEITSNTTAINVQQGQIDTIISNTTITKEDGQTVSLKDDYNITKNTVDSQSTKIGSLETAVNTVSSKQASMELDLNGFRTEVSNTYATKEEINLSNYNLINNGDFQNCYAGTYDMIPSWICDDDLKVYYYRDDGEGWAFLNEATMSGDMKGIRQNPDLKENTLYTLSFKAGWQEHVNQDMACSITFSDSNWNELSVITVPITNNNLNLSDLQTFTFTTPAYFYDCEIEFFFGEHIGFNDLLCASFLHEVKLEEGDTYTGWRGSEYDETPRFGGNNHILNGNFANYSLEGNTQVADWYHDNTRFEIWELNGQSPYNKDGTIYMANMTTEPAGLWQDVHDLSPNTEYTLSYYISWETNVVGTYLEFYVYSGEELRFMFEIEHSKGGTYNHTFSTPNVPNLRIVISMIHKGQINYTNGGMLMYFGNVMLEKGNYPSEWSENPKNYTTKTEFQQTTEDFTFKIQQSGGANLLRNSKFKKGTDFWYYLCWDESGTYNRTFGYREPNRSWNHENDRCLEYFCLSYAPGAVINGGFDSHQIEAEPNTTYSFTCYLASHRSNYVILEIVGYKEDGTREDCAAWNLGTLGESTASGRGYQNWTKVEKTFTTRSSTRTFHIRIYMLNHNGDTAALDSYLWMALPCLTKSAVPMEWQPHNEELYDGIVSIDQYGLSVKQGNNKSVLDSEALQFYAGDVRYSRIIGGKFEFTDNSGARIGTVGKSTWIGTGIGLSSLSAIHGHSASLGAQYSPSDENVTSPLIVCSQDGYLSSSGGYYFQGLNMTSPKISGAAYFRGSTASTSILQYQGMMVYANTSGVGHIFGDNGVLIGTMYGADLYTGITVEENSGWNGKNIIHCHGPLDMHQYPIANCQNVAYAAAASTYTTKLLEEGSIENTMYGGYSFTEGELRYTHRQTCHTVEEWDYNDEGVWSPLGVYYCYCELPIFMAENIELDYHVNIGKIGWGDYRVIEKNPYLFIVESQEEGFAFTWEVVAKQVEKATNNTVVANEYINTDTKQAMPTEEEGFTCKLDGEVFLEEEEIQGNIITGEE